MTMQHAGRFPNSATSASRRVATFFRSTTLRSGSRAHTSDARSRRSKPMVRNERDAVALLMGRSPLAFEAASSQPVLPTAGGWPSHLILTDVDRLADQAERHRIEALLEDDVCIRVHLGLIP